MGHTGVTLGTCWGDALGTCLGHTGGADTYLEHVGDTIEGTLGTHGDDLGAYWGPPIVATWVALGSGLFHVPVSLCVLSCPCPIPMPPPPCLLCPHSPGGRVSPGSHQEERGAGAR